MMIDGDGIAVIGAGLVGCVLAKLLAARGLAVNIFEKREKINSTHIGNGRSTHLIISQRGAKALQKIGVLDEVLQSAIPLVGRLVHELDSSLSTVKYGVNNQAIFAIQRESLNRILINACTADSRIRILYGAQCEAIDVNSKKLSLSMGDAAEVFKVSAAKIFICDGANSKLRSQLINSNGFNFIQRYEEYGYKELIISKDAAKHLETEFMHAWPRGNFSLFAFPNHDGTFTSTLIAPLGEEGFGSISSREELDILFSKNFSDLNVEELVSEYLEKPVSYLKSSSCSPWSFNSSVLLLGDAAHTMLPFLGQGMNCGFEDCTVFDELLNDNAGDLDVAITMFESLRKHNCDCITEMSRNAFHEFTVQMADKKYIHEKYIENKICELSKGKFTNSYQMLAFSCIPYCEINEQEKNLKILTASVINKLESMQSLLYKSEHQIARIIMSSIEELEYAIN
jgi:kynurenine 3-monooxygenase